MYLILTNDYDFVMGNPVKYLVKLQWKKKKRRKLRDSWIQSSYH